MVPAQIQAQLQGYYDLTLPQHVGDYLITDRRIANYLDNSTESYDTNEKLLVLEEPDGLNVSLFLADELLSNLDSNNPFEDLNNTNLNEFCTVLEGVSHFIYLAYNAGHDRPVSQLELELQAEVDKFVSIILLAKQQEVRVCWENLADFLFSRCGFDPQLSDQDRRRYLEANDFASAFCAHLTQRSRGEIDHVETRSELCRFYRKRHFDKLSRCGEPRAIPAP